MTSDVLKAAAWAIAAILAICVIGWALGGTEPEPAQPDASLITLDTSNAALMHRYGLPTAEDVMHYKVDGWWGYRDEVGNDRSYTELPGMETTWLDLYGLRV